MQSLQTAKKYICSSQGKQSYTDKLASQGLLTNLVIFLLWVGSAFYAVCFDVSNFIELDSRPAKPFNEKSIFIIFCLCTRYAVTYAALG